MRLQRSPSGPSKCRTPSTHSHLTKQQRYIPLIFILKIANPKGCMERGASAAAYDLSRKLHTSDTFASCGLAVAVHIELRKLTLASNVAPSHVITIWRHCQKIWALFLLKWLSCMAKSVLPRKLVIQENWSPTGMDYCLGCWISIWAATGSLPAAAPHASHPQSISWSDQDIILSLWQICCLSNWWRQLHNAEYFPHSSSLH